LQYSLIYKNLIETAQYPVSKLTMSTSFAGYNQIEYLPLPIIIREGAGGRVNHCQFPQ